MLVGPALGYVGRAGPVTLGVLTQTLLGDAEKRTTIQPIVALTLAPWISLGLGEIELEWDWERGRWDALPVGLAVDAVVDVAGQFFRIGIEGRYNWHDVDGLYETRVAAHLAVLAR